MKVDVDISRRGLALYQGLATFLESEPDHSNLYFKRAEGNKKNDYDSCNKMIMIVAENFNLNSITLQLKNRYIIKVVSKCSSL